MINIIFKLSHCFWCPVPVSHISLSLINEAKKRDPSIFVFSLVPQAEGEGKAGEQCGKRGDRKGGRREVSGETEYLRPLGPAQNNVDLTT